MQYICMQIRVNKKMNINIFVKKIYIYAIVFVSTYVRFYYNKTHSMTHRLKKNAYRNFR